MKLYRFEKWYADLLTSEREYLLVFHTLLEVFGIRICFVEINRSRFKEVQDLHINRKLKGIKSSEHTISVREGHFHYGIERGGIKLHLDEMQLELNINPVHSQDYSHQGMIIRRKGSGYLIWKPIYLKTRMEGRILNRGEGEKTNNEQVLLGTGYVDYLFSCMLPFRVPVRQLYWGRLHSQDFDLTYSYALGIHDKICGAKMMIRTGEEVYWMDKFEIQAEQWEQFEPPGLSSPATYRIETRTNRIQVVLKVRHLKPAIISEFMENPKELGRISMMVLRLLSREPRGIKFYSSANVEFSLDGNTQKLEEIFMIDEYVRFV